MELGPLLPQATPHARHHVNSLGTSLGQDSPHLDHFPPCVELPGRPLAGQPDRCYAVAYLDHLVTLGAGERKVFVLQRHMQRPWTHSEVASIRSSAPSKEMLPLTEYIIPLSYSSDPNPLSVQESDHYVCLSRRPETTVGAVRAAR